MSAESSSSPSTGKKRNIDEAEIDDDTEVLLVVVGVTDGDYYDCVRVTMERYEVPLSALGERKDAILKAVEESTHVRLAKLSIVKRLPGEKKCTKGPREIELLMYRLGALQSMWLEQHPDHEEIKRLGNDLSQYYTPGNGPVRGRVRYVLTVPVDHDPDC